MNILFQAIDIIYKESSGRSMPWRIPKRPDTVRFEDDGIQAACERVGNINIPDVLTYKAM